MTEQDYARHLLRLLREAAAAAPAIPTGDHWA